MKEVKEGKEERGGEGRNERTKGKRKVAAAMFDEGKEKYDS